MTASFSNKLRLFAAKLRNYVWLGIKLAMKSVDCKTWDGYVNMELCERSKDSGAAGNGNGRYGSKEETQVGSFSLITPTEKESHT